MKMAVIPNVGLFVSSTHSLSLNMLFCAGEVGGLMGLLLGASVLTMGEVADLVIYNAMRKWSESRKKKDTKRKASTTMTGTTVKGQIEGNLWEKNYANMSNMSQFKERVADEHSIMGKNREMISPGSEKRKTFTS